MKQRRESAFPILTIIEIYHKFDILGQKKEKTRISKYLRQRQLGRSC